MLMVLLAVTGVLAVLVGVLAWRVHRLEQRLSLVSVSDPVDEPSPRETPLQGSSVEKPAAPEFVITRMGELGAEPGPVPTVPAPVFADLVLKETVVQTASLFHGLRRALTPETRHRIRFHMRQEVKRSRKQRRAELKEVRREWAARQRAAMAADEPEGSAA